MHCKLHTNEEHERRMVSSSLVSVLWILCTVEQRCSYFATPVSTRQYDTFHLEPVYNVPGIAAWLHTGYTAVNTPSCSCTLGIRTFVFSVDIE